MLQFAMLKMRRIFILLLFMGTSLYSVEMTQAQLDETIAKCEAGKGEECSKLYYYYISSKRRYVKGLKFDKKKALEYAVKACDLDDRDGCFAAGMDHYYGDDHMNIPRDKEKGRKLLRKACKLGMDDVCSYFLNPKF